MTQEATVGYWEGTPDHRKRREKPKGYASLEYLSESRRLQVLMGELSCQFAVSGSFGNAMLSVGGVSDVCSIKTPKKKFFESQLKFLRDYSDLRNDRMAEIIIQLDDIRSFFGAQLPMNPWQRKATAHLLALTQSIAIQVEMQVKHYCYVLRPAEYSKYIQPIIQTPDHSAFPSGHATEAFALATVLYKLAGTQSLANGLKGPSSPFRLAHRIAVNRTIAGVHFPVDSAAGATLGVAIGSALIALGEKRNGKGKTEKLPKTNFDPAMSEKNEDFTLKWVKERLNHDLKKNDQSTAPTPHFSALWANAVEEW
ncbi:vanadium-dependent haloperoxidase [Sulfitobacter pacificus]|uniref:vanadium-dependent haloperoxidase n=1 Tax=Sulfitobacter pacificus TaxID=1499314 RepID=UPI003341BF84